MNGEFRNISRSSLTVSSILQYLHQLRCEIDGNLPWNLRIGKLPKFHRCQRFLMRRRDLEQCFSDLAVVEVRQTAVCGIMSKIRRNRLSGRKRGRDEDRMLVSLKPSNSPVWCITTIAPGLAIVCKTASVLIASNARPPALRTIVASLRLCQQACSPRLCETLKDDEAKTD